MSKKLDGKVVAITGAGSGIGRETALLCARRGASLAVSDVNEAGGSTRTAEAAARLAATYSRSASTSRHASRWTAFACARARRFGGVDLLDQQRRHRGRSRPSPRPSSRTGSASFRSTSWACVHGAAASCRT